MPRGRPKKHANAEAAQQSQAESKLRYRRRKRDNASARPEFIAYTPQLSGNVPTATPDNIGLQISVDTRVPKEPARQASDKTLEEPALFPSLIRSPSHEDAELAQRIEIEEADQADEQAEYDAAIARAIEESGTHIADGHAITTEIQCDTNTEGVGSRRAPASPLPESTRGRTADQCNAPSKTPTPTSSSLRTPDQRSATPSRSTSRKRTRPFPTQSNTLMTWLSPSPAAPTARSNPSPLPFEQAPTAATPISNTTNVAIPIPSVSSYPERVATSLPSPMAPPPAPTPRTATPATPPTATPPDLTSPTVTPPTATLPTATPHSPSPNPAESTAYKLAKQLRGFQGCTHEQHEEAEGLHQAYHQRVDVHSACSSLPQITSLIRGDYAGGTPLPSVLSNPKLMQPADLPAGLDLAGAFEGISATAFPEDAGTPDEHLPRSLCLSQHHDSSAKDRAPKTTFDVDSLCCFPSSLGFARQGIHWYPGSHAFLNLSQDIHFGLPEASFDRNGEVVTTHVPLHKIPHCCFGTAVGMESLGIFILFPELRIDSQYDHSNFLSTSDHELWYDAVLLPALTQIVGNTNRLQHYPVSAHVAKLDATALAAETFAQKETARERLLKYFLQSQDLDLLWTLVQERIAANPGCARFNNATLFAHSTNTKLEHMEESLVSAYGRWEQCWARVADPHFYSRDRTFVDIGKQVTSEDSTLPYDTIPEACEAEVYLWKRCCLEAYANTRIGRLANGKRTKGSARLTTYPWATMRETMGQTLFAEPQGQESMDGLVYSQFYSLIKTPFDTSKAYVFHNEALENLALDPGYVRSLQQQGGGVTFSKGVCQESYLHSKKRAHANLVDNQWRSYGIREEHRVSLTLMDAVHEQWTQWDLYDDRIDDARRPRPYFIIPTKALLEFLSAQINKYCFLFEYTLAHTARTYSLPETMIMVAALRALRFCYGSNMLARESLLYKDRWEQPRGQEMVVKEGLGMMDTMERCGLGWFLPKINWATLQFAPPHGENMLVGNLLLHQEYKRRWRAVKDLRDVFVRFNQAEGWYTQHQMAHQPRVREMWLEYLHALNLEQFDADVQKAMLAAHKHHPELSPAAADSGDPISYCYRGMRKLFLVDGREAPPYLVTGNKRSYHTVGELLDVLFQWGDKQKRAGWGSKPYRLILQKTYEMIERRLGYDTARRWLDEYYVLVRLTHWVLPYAKQDALIMGTKQSTARGLQRRMMWFSSIYSDPDAPQAYGAPCPNTVYKELWRARRDKSPTVPWSTSQLLKASRTADLGVDNHWRAGRVNRGSSRWEPTWERGMAPVLAMREQIRNKSLTELDELMIAYALELSQEGRPAEDTPAAQDAPARPVQRGTGRLSIRDFFGQQGQGSARGSTASQAKGSSHSSFHPSSESGR